MNANPTHHHHFFPHRTHRPVAPSTEVLFKQRWLTSLLLTAGLVVVDLVILFAFGLESWPVVVIPLPFAVALLWLSVDALRADEIRSR